MNPDTGIFLGKSIKVLLKKDILLGNVGEDEVNLCLVAGGTSADNSLDDLKHGGNTSSSGNHAKVAYHVGSVDKSALGSANANGLANGKAGQILRDVTGGVRLDEQVEVAGLVIARDGSVGANNLLASAIILGDGSADRDVLANG